jgi:hypothetical protein
LRLQSGLQGDSDDELRGEIQSELLSELFFAALRMTRGGFFNSPNLWMITPGAAVLRSGFGSLNSRLS